MDLSCFTRAIKALHFSTLDLRNKLYKSHIDTNHHIIAQDSTANNTILQVRLDVYPPTQSCWHEIQGYLHKEMNLHIRSFYNDALVKNNIFPPWTIAFQLPPKLMMSQNQTETIVLEKKSSQRNAQ